ncbi:hypothetical protein WJX72_012411 [[Myrmecia] bisecta]|uniref:Coiled-coil-helix-coiled-coil-helix domain-containing protein 3, mitochondrial n=1 Tax=[Myrmecia] bisecta TaxID=41462 RepID=A0AAW1QC93_9CHLO
MGAAQGKAVDMEEALPLETGVRVTQSLLQQLTGKAKTHVRPHQAAQGAATSLAAVHLPPHLEQEVLATLQRDKQLKRALERSTRAGALLLKAEREEVAQVDALAEELTQKEYRAPARPPPCQAEREACLYCYQDNYQDPLRCADKVEAFSQCARQAHAAFVG